MWQTIAKQLSLFSGSETSNKPPISRMLENCILDDLQEIKFLEALLCGKTQEVFD